MNLHLLSIFWKKRKSMLMVTVVALITSIIISFIIPYRYKSVATIYPVNLTSYSDETPTEQLMQFLNSVDVKEVIRKKYNLYKHYHIDSTNVLAETYYFGMIEENIILNQTKYGSIQIIVYDKSPKMAKDLVEGIIDAANIHIRSLKNQKLLETIKTDLMFMNSRKKAMDSVDFLLKDFSLKYGINNYSDKIENAAKYYYKSIPEGRSEGLALKLKELELQGLEEQWKERKTKVWSEQYKIYMVDFNETQQEHDKCVRDINKNVSYIVIASKPILPNKADSPKRLIFILFFTVCTIFLFFIYNIFENKIKNLKEVFFN